MLAATMHDARTTFLAELYPQTARDEVTALRAALTETKRTHLAKLEAGVALSTDALVGLFDAVVSIKVKLSAHVGLGVTYALSVWDDHAQGTSLSRCDRESREALTEACAPSFARKGSPMVQGVTLIESQRLQWRHCHELMSWLLFRRDDDKFPPQSRLEKLSHYEVVPKLLKARGLVLAHLGPSLSVAVESFDRFSLANRWRLPESPEHNLEVQAWSALTYQNQAFVELEAKRRAMDVLPLEDDNAAARSLRSQHSAALQKLLAESLAFLPDLARSAV